MLRASPKVRALALCSLMLGALAPASALAQTPGEQLFIEGRKLMDEGKVDEACDRFEKSYALEGALGSLLNLANCEEKRGKLRVALGLWKKAASTAGDQEKNRLYALGRAGALEEKLAYVMVVMGTAVAGAVATIDGEVVALGEKIVVEPGKHVIEVTANGQTQRREVSVDAKETRSVELWSAAPDAGQASGAGAGTGAAPAESSRTNLAPWGWASIAVGGASAIGFAATGFAILAQCDAPVFDTDGTRVGDNGCSDGKPWELGVPNLVTGIVAVAGVGLGVTLLVIEAGADDSVEVGAVTLPGGGAALGLRGRF